MLDAAELHFNEDIARARALLDHARTLPAGSLRDDVLRSVCMLAVGACDAFYSDAYADLLARTLQAKQIQPAVPIPDRVNRLKIPVIAVIRQSKGGWRWRMAARELIEDENVLAIEKIKSLFNQFFASGRKLLTAETIEAWIEHPQAKQRMFGIGRASYRGLAAGARGQAKTQAIKKLEVLFNNTFQRRHDCIHNCDRPKMALQSITDTFAQKRIEDITFLVDRCKDELRREFPAYLRRLGFSGVTRNRVGA